ncbi:MAG: hypothetical protein JJE03_00720 [Peptostreptococcaceae bacterium]|nr:hypothetical protein [Peptostreptococcaceae bacterium]
MNKFKKIFNPEYFQGNIKSNNYFEGWYYKLTNLEESFSYAIIPGVSLSDSSHAFIQVIEGSTGKTYNFTFDLKDFSYGTNEFFVKIGDNVFAKKSIKLNLKNEEFELSGIIDFDEVVDFPKNILSPGIMGIFSYIPYMQCNHGVVNITHKTSGQLLLNNIKLPMDNGYGYIEKDWGNSFPSSWLWLQGNNFENTEASFMLSVANVPFMGSEFVGFLGFLYFDGEVHKFATYNRSKIKNIELNGNNLSVTIKKNQYTLKISATNDGVGTLKAPVNGSMTSTVNESINANITITLEKDNEVIFQDTSYMCGMEVSELSDELIGKINKGS